MSCAHVADLFWFWISAATDWSEVATDGSQRNRTDATSVGPNHLSFFHLLDSLGRVAQGFSSLDETSQSPEKCRSDRPTRIAEGL